MLYTCGGSDGYLDELRGADPIAPAHPRQVNLDSSAERSLGGITLTHHAQMDVDAVVVTTRNFGDSSNIMDQIAPKDLGLAWGNVSAPFILRRIRFNTDGRFMSWRLKEPVPLSNLEIAMSMGNFHLIPASKRVADSINRVVPGDKVRLQGFLVTALHPSGWTATSSLSRSDSGEGACEIMVVDAIEVVKLN